MSLGNIEQGTAGIKKQAKELIEQAYKRGYKAGYDKAFATLNENWQLVTSEAEEKGRNEAWEAIRKLYWLPDDAIREIFGVHNWMGIVQKFSASETINKLCAYEEQKKQEEDERIEVDKEKVIKLADEIGIHKLFAIVKEIRGE